MGQSQLSTEAIKAMTAHWTRAQPTVAAFIHSLVRDPHAAEDLLQQTAERVVERYGQYDPNRPFLPWVMTIAKHCVFDQARRDGRKTKVTLLGEAAEAVVDAFAAEPPLDQSAVASLRKCLERLTPKARQAVGLRYGNDWKPKRIAEHLGMTANAATVMLHRAKAALRTCLETATVAGGEPQ